MFVKFLVLLKWVQARVFINGHSITFDMKKKTFKKQFTEFRNYLLGRYDFLGKVSITPR